MKINFDQPRKDSKDIEQITNYVFKGTIADDNQIAHQPLEGREGVADKEAENFFKAINPDGYFLSEVKEKLTDEIKQKQDYLKSIIRSDLYGVEEKNSLTTAANFQIRDLEKWIGYLEFYLSSKSPNAIKELKEKIAKDSKLIDEAVKNQKSELN